MKAQKKHKKTPNKLNFLTFQIGGYNQSINHKGMACDCRWSSLYPLNYKRGDQICRHLKKVIKINRLYKE